MNDSQFWIKLWEMVGICFIFILIVCGLNYYHSMAVYQEAITAGVDPIAYRCGLDSLGDKPMCIQYISEVYE